MGDMIVEISKTGSPISLPLSGWYFGVYDNQDVLTNVPINDERSYSINKLGLQLALKFTLHFAVNEDFSSAYLVSQFC